jgi:hypothetical protein
MGEKTEKRTNPDTETSPAKSSACENERNISIEGSDGVNRVFGPMHFNTEECRTE